MFYFKKMNSFIGEITILCDETHICGLWIEGQAGVNSVDLSTCSTKETTILRQAEEWLTQYFEKKNPSISSLPLHWDGSPFQNAVWEELCTIPYGTTTTYKRLGERVAKRVGKVKMSAQAIGQAVGKNPISIIVPCHRVIGTNGTLVGYNGGIEKKKALLLFESEN